MTNKKTPVVSTRNAPRARRGKAATPKDTHGTQVRFNVLCTRCGSEDTLPFVPKTTNSLLCRRCAQEAFGDGWANGREMQDMPSRHPFTCAKCGRLDTVPFKPRPESELFCQACLRGEEQSKPDRLKGMKKVE